MIAVRLSVLTLLLGVVLGGCSYEPSYCSECNQGGRTPYYPFKRV